MKWIDINDERPEKGKLVLVCNPEWKSPNILVASMDYDWEFSCFMPVKYWMELPEMP